MSHALLGSPSPFKVYECYLFRVSYSPSSIDQIHFLQLCVAFIKLSYDEVNVKKFVLEIKLFSFSYGYRKCTCVDSLNNYIGLPQLYQPLMQSNQ